MINFNGIKGAIFDLDGTLFDSMGVWDEIDRKFFAKRGLSMPSDYQDAVKRMHFPEAARYTVTRFAFRESEEEIVNEWLEMTKEAYAYDVELKPYAKETLTVLSARGIKLGIATSSAPELFMPVLERCGILPLFSAVARTEEVSRGKGFPDVYLLAAERLNLAPEECAVFEDILHGIKGAKSGGFTTAAVYDRFSAREEAELRREADCYITSYKGFLRHFRRS